MSALNSPFKKTLKESVSFVGIGLHSGIKTTLTVRPCEDDSGIFFCRKDVKPSKSLIPARWHNVIDTTLSTIIGNQYGTTVSTIKTLEKAGARKIYVGATHPVMCGPAVDLLSKSSAVEVVVTNTVAVPEDKQFPQLNVLSVAGFFAKAIRHIHTGESVGALFT